ncbi:hypothetical protein QFC21_001511 [Naganishia friedmannii]|uniref:Uncharacterized protein n=1 Tax=Naganishia friedmannii TaxID=89922 RepID=A0ACC2W5I2_9TREE|nr:hypothetical protein QFC21_001511 [Naganishia friedmannii]
MSSRQQLQSNPLPSPRQRQHQPYPQYPNHAEQKQQQPPTTSEMQQQPPHLSAPQQPPPPRTNSDSSSSLYSLSAYSTDIQNQPVHSPVSQAHAAGSLYADNGAGYERGQGAGQGQKEINLDDYLEELRIANASPSSASSGAQQQQQQRELTGLGIMGEAGSRNESPFASSPLSHGSPANLASSSENPSSRSNTYDSTSIPFSTSMSSTTSSLSQYSLYQPQQISPSLPGAASSFAAAGSSSLPERESSLPVSPNPNTFTQPSDEQTPQAPSNPQLQKLAHSERQRDLRRISTESARSNDTYSASTSQMGASSFEPETSMMMTATTSGQTIKQEGNWSTGGAKGSIPINSSSSATTSQQARPKIGNPGGTPLFDLSSASRFDDPPALDVVDLSTSPPSTFPAFTNLAGLAAHSPRPSLAASPNVSNPSATTFDYLSAPAGSGNQSPLGDMGTGLGIGMPQQGQQGEMTMATGSRTPGGGGVQMTFDEGLLRTLCDLDCALPLITERIKQSITSCRQIAAFFRSRAELEDKYARSMSELVRSSADSYSRAFCKAGSFVEAYNATLRVHDTLAQNRLRFAQRLIEMSDELINLAKEGERLRKVHKESGSRHEKSVQDAEFAMEKAKSRFDSTAEELERILVTKEGESIKDANGISGSGKEAKRGGIGKAMSKGLFKAKNPAQIQRQEDETRARMNSASEQFKKAVQDNQATKQEFFNLQLPKILRQMKECADELDMGCQYHMARYAYLFETTLLADGSAVLPVSDESGMYQNSLRAKQYADGMHIYIGEKAGLKAIVETIDNRNDFKTFMQNFTVARGSQKGPSRNVPYDDGSLPAMPPHVHASHYGIAQPSQQQSQLYSQSSQQHPYRGTSSVYSNGESTVSHMNQGVNTGSHPSHSSGMTFGVELSEQAVVTGTEVPKVVAKCTEAIEAFGLDQVGIYRLSGTTSKVQKLKAALDADLDNINVMDDEWSSDINVVASVLKQWFRELPEPLLTHGLYQGFIDAARYENDRLRHIRLHEQVNELPDANYATLKHFMGHLDKIRSMEKINHMSVSNLSIVFGPTLLGAPPELGSMNLEHMSFQCKAIETILLKYKEIFVEEDSESSTPAAA